MDNNNPTRQKRNKVINIVGIVLCVIFVLLLIFNVVTIIDGFIHKDEVPGFFNLTPMIVTTDSMKGTINGGDLVICKDTEASEVEVGDIISFYDPMSTKKAVVTHRVTEKYTADGQIYFRTKGDANNAQDYLPVSGDKLVGKYAFRIPLAGHILMFMQTTLGLVVCIGVPLILFLVYEFLRHRKSEKENETDIDRMRAELEALRAAKENQESAGAADTENVTDGENIQSDTDRPDGCDIQPDGRQDGEKD